MKHESIDEALGQGADCTPPPNFARRVMRAVHQARQAPLRFPWLRLVAAALGAGALAALAWWACAFVPLWLVVLAGCAAGAVGVLLVMRESDRGP